MTVSPLEEYLGFDDVVIVPGRSKVEPAEVDITGSFTRRISLSIPLASSPMDTVTEARMAIALARAGAIGVIHRNMSREEQASEVSKVKKAAPSLWAEVPRIPHDKPLEAGLLLMESTGSSAAIVTSPGGVVGYLVLDRPGTDYWLNKAEGIAKLVTHVKPVPSIDEDGRLRVAAAISPFDLERARILERAGVDALVVDVAHLHNENALASLSKLVRGVSVEVVAGNIGTREAVLDVLSKVEDVAGLRVGIASGSICVTGEVAGAAVPTLTAVINARSALEELGLQGRIPIIADGGVRGPGDAAKAIIAGASAVMAGRLLAGSEESPGPKIRVGGRYYKPYRGMGSKGAMERRFAADRYSKPSKAIEEGVEGLVPYSGSVFSVVSEFAAGLKAALGYAGASSIREAWRSRLARVSPSTRAEIKPHDILLGG